MKFELTEQEYAVIRDCLANATVPVHVASAVHIPLVQKLEKQYADNATDTPTDR